MKDSIAYLPKDKQDDLVFLVKEILKRLPQTEYIILYGSYARGNYVRRSVRIEDGGIPTVKISDYDIYVITSGFNSKKAETVLDNVEARYTVFCSNERGYRYPYPESQITQGYYETDLRGEDKGV